MNKPRKLKSIKLNGNNLPWIDYPDSVKHLGTTIDNSQNGLLSTDVLQKRAKFTQCNNELLQEFYFANPEIKCHINNIYNMSLYGSSLWDLFSSAVESLEKTYNRAVRTMWDIPLDSHRYLIEPLSDQPHMRFTLYKRMINFKNQVFKSSKSALKHMYSICQNNCASVTGRNLRKLMLLCDHSSIYSLNSSDIDCLEYFPIPNLEKWMIGF